MSEKKKGWPIVGSLRRSDTGNYIKLAEGYKIVGPDGEVPMTDKRTIRLEDPRAKVKDMFANGYISEQQRDERLEKLEDMQWLRYDLVVPPPRTTQN